MGFPTRGDSLKTRLAAVALALLVGCASAPIVPRCRIVDEHLVASGMPPGFAEFDAALLRRGRELTFAARDLRSFLNQPYLRYFATDCLPVLCDELAQARIDAAAGRLTEAGARYQTLLAATQLVALRMAVMQVIDYADAAGQPSFQIASIESGFDVEIWKPLWDPLFQNGPAALPKVLEDSPAKFEKTLGTLDSWTKQLRLGEERVKIAKVLRDTFIVAAGAMESAQRLAEIASTRPPPGIGALAGGSTLALDGAAAAEAVAAIRSLIAMGALDPAIVVGISRMDGAAGVPGLPKRPPGEKPEAPQRAPQGGAYRDIRGTPAEAHHMPADSVSPLSKGEGPAIRMEPSDHQQTANWGPAGKAYRARQKALIDAGRFRDAQQMDINEIRAKFGSKYDEALKQMVDYTNTIPPQKLLPTVAGGAP